MVERRVVKEAINSYKALSKIEGLSKIDWTELNAKNYNPRVLDLGVFKSGDELDVNKVESIKIASKRQRSIMDSVLEKLNK